MSSIINLKAVAANSHDSIWVRIDQFTIDLANKSHVHFRMKGVVSALDPEKGDWSEMRRDCDRTIFCRSVDSVEIEWFEDDDFYALYIDEFFICAGDYDVLERIKSEIIKHILGK